jgi:hypothetical protein
MVQLLYQRVTYTNEQLTLERAHHVARVVCLYQYTYLTVCTLDQSERVLQRCVCYPNSSPNTSFDC